LTLGAVAGLSDKNYTGAHLQSVAIRAWMNFNDRPMLPPKWSKSCAQTFFARSWKFFKIFADFIENCGAI